MKPWKVGHKVIEILERVAKGKGNLGKGGKK
jgi:hypothetical protein